MAENVIKKDIEQQISDYQNIINPCPVYKHKKEAYDDVCLLCSYFYSSKFELRQPALEDLEKAR